VGGGIRDSKACEAGAAHSKCASESRSSSRAISSSSVPPSANRGSPSIQLKAENKGYTNPAMMNSTLITKTTTENYSDMIYLVTGQNDSGQNGIRTKWY